MASDGKKKELLKGPLEKSQQLCPKAPASRNTLFFAQPQAHDQRVTVFDSSITPEPFLDSVVLENLRKRQQLEGEAEGSGTS
ncbi:uncharacterized protein Z519_12679 [Cladophialophora bantiana CBS 173.52]|uniref:Uncharacterized protein n=1 Tax=Cladophialophora bantiana (strain ATCC 10958 / CBS 173.52 / CDC B-1940 / NIH 8579) TaxID=1442370 RepID=A0A0D2H085_CLAB1|nr:uncharacterized protein Z519_12679 [Cladophialophora bantiana CBS 173.52]KIW86693.1 hypothetical protein Z519_12679 [Cladophialophora bantiana CBS 173.52]